MKKKMRFFERVFTSLLNILLVPLVPLFVVSGYSLWAQCAQKIVKIRK